MKIYKRMLSVIVLILAITSVTFCIENKKQGESPISEDSIKEKIKNKLIGVDIVYQDKTGKNQTFTVKSEDIKTIENVLLEGKKSWKVRIGETVAWDYYFDDKGEDIIKTEQLFKT